MSKPVTNLGNSPFVRDLSAQPISLDSPFKVVSANYPGPFLDSYLIEHLIGTGKLVIFKITTNSGQSFLSVKFPASLVSTDSS
jgi:hypothetical protein